MADYIGVLADLRIKLEQVDAERAELLNAIAAIERIAGTSESKPPKVTLVNRGGKQPTMQGAIGLVLEAQRDWMTTAEIVAALKNNGYSASPKSYRAQVYNTLWRIQRTGQFVQDPATKKWGLKEWPK